MTDEKDPDAPETPRPPSMEGTDEARAFEAGFELPTEEEISEVEAATRSPGVSAGKGRVLIFGALFVAAMAYIATMFFGGPSKVDTGPAPGSDPNNPVETATGIAQAPAQVTDTMRIPAPPPPIQPPTAPLPPLAPPALDPAAIGDTGAPTGDGLAPPPPPPPPPPEIKALKPFGDDKKTQERLRAGMIVSGVTTSGVRTEQPGGMLSPEGQAARESLAQKDSNIAYLNNALRASGAEKAQATKVPDLDTTIIQGKIVEAVLETAINTDLPGTIRAIVSRDVYAESGRNVMVPKGSRLIGNYNTGIMRGQKRVMIVWTRLIRPDGVDVQIGSSAVDALGRAGMSGIVDNKYMEIFSTAILTSMVSLGVAVLGEAVTDGDSTSTTNTDGSSTTTGGAGAAAVGQAAANVGGIANEVIKETLDSRPTIVIDQGTRINVFVNRDLKFATEKDDKGQPVK